MKRTLLFIMAFLPILASADAVEIDGIYYNLDNKSKTAEVTSNPNQHEGSDYEAMTAGATSSPNQYEGDVAIPESVTYDDVVYSVTSIGWAAFKSCSGLTSITIPHSVTSIADGAFYGCSGLTSITIPSSVTSIGEWAFSSCSGLTSITIGNGVISIGDYAFQSCTSLTSITIPSSVTSIGKYSFFDCSGLKSIAVENGNPVYDSRESCKALIKTSDNELILGCMNSTIPNSVTRIGQAAFQNCKRLLSVRIPNSVVSVGQNAFYNCSGLTSVTIPNSVTSIGEAAFRGCSGLTSITIPNSVTSIGEYVFYNCSGLTSVTIPNSVTFIGLCAFAYCSGLTSVTIPNSVTFIDNHAFQFCSGLTSITIGSGTITIGDQVFACCSELTDVYCYAKSVPYTYADSYSNAFKDSPIEYATLHVPAGSVSAYKAARPWKNFKKIVALTNNSNTPKYFPTGMTWEEVVVNPDMEVEDNNACIYEIGTDTIIGDVTYKKVLRNNVFSGLCVRESGDKVWLLAKEYPTEILLYNFDWDSNQEIVTEYLKGQDEEDDDYKVCQETTPVGDSQTVEIEGKTYQYIIKRLSGTVIRGIGKVAELNRYPCLLSYREPAENLPGLDYLKVHWIKRNGVEIFRSESAKEWIEEIKDDYRPFVEEGKVWKVVDGDTDNPAQVVDYYYFDGDTIIDGKTCKQMMKMQYVNPDHPYYESFPKSPFKVGTWYEEDKKVYFYDEGQQSMVLKYDFSLEANDTLKFLNVDGYIPFIIGPKQTGGIKGFKGVYRDIMICAEKEQNMHYTTWLEGVGDIEIPTRDIYYEFVWAPYIDLKNHILMSCTVGDEVIYLNDDFEDGATPAEARKRRFDFTHTTKIQPKARMRSGAEESIYGEYNDLRLGINLEPLDDAYLVQITDESGKVVYEKNINTDDIVGLNIDISDYPEGCYTVTVENSQETFTGEFEAQTTGIVEVRRNTEEIRSNIYNLQGQRLSSLKKGLNIVNGQKIYVR